MRGSATYGASSKKRVVPDPLKLIMKWDVYASDTLCKIVSRYMPLRTFKTYYKGLEYSCNGIVWLTAWLAFLWILWKPSLFEMQVNFFIGLITDIFAIAILKATTRRRRPPQNQQDTLTLGPDKYSFPSGHVSRAFYIACFFIYLYPLPSILMTPLLSWAAGVSITRVLLRRHYILDVTGGAVVGLLNCFLINLIWLSGPTTLWLVRWISDEKLDGDMATD